MPGRPGTKPRQTEGLNFFPRVEAVTTAPAPTAHRFLGIANSPSPRAFDRGVPNVALRLHPAVLQTTDRGRWISADPPYQVCVRQLKICDPARGSGHFLVALVDYLADQVITAMAEAEATIACGHYVSPLANRIEEFGTLFLATPSNEDPSGFRAGRRAAHGRIYSKCWRPMRTTNTR